MPEIKRAIALGFFDGVHLGHAALLKKTKQRAEEIDAVPSVLSFDVHPDMLVFGKDVPLINSALGREEIIRRCFGIDTSCLSISISTSCACRGTNSSIRLSVS